MNYTPERTRTTRCTTKAKESTPIAPPNPPRQTRSKRSAQTRVNTGVATPTVKKQRVVSPSSKGKGKRITELDTAKFMEVNFSDAKGKLDNTKLERFQGIFAKNEIKPCKVVKIEELKGVFKHFDAVKDSGVFKFLMLSAPYYPSLIRIFYSNAEYKVRSIDPLTKEHWIESSVMGKKIEVTNEVLEKILELPNVGIEWYQTDIENEKNHDEAIKECKGTGDLGFDDRVLFAIITNGLRHIRAGTSSINLEDRYFMQCIKSRMPVRWSSFIIHDMERVISKETTYLYYSMLLTKVFEHFGIDVSVAEGQRANGKTEVGYASLKQYGYYKDEEGNWLKKDKKGQKPAQIDKSTEV